MELTIYSHIIEILKTLLTTWGLQWKLIPEIIIREKIGVKYTDIATLKNLHNEYREKAFRKNELEKRKTGLLSDIENGEINIKKAFSGIYTRPVAKKDWQRKVDELRVKMTSVQDEFREKTGELKGFGVDPTDYVKEKPKVEYSKNKLDLAQKEMGAFKG